jgi:primosomal protein N'
MAFLARYEVEAPEATPAAVVCAEIRCAACGYGAVVARLPERCPMCGSASWRAPSADRDLVPRPGPERAKQELRRELLARVRNTRPST